MQWTCLTGLTWSKVKRVHNRIRIENRAFYKQPSAYLSKDQGAVGVQRAVSRLLAENVFTNDECGATFVTQVPCRKEVSPYGTSKALNKIYNRQSPSTLDFQEIFCIRKEKYTTGIVGDYPKVFALHASGMKDPGWRAISNRNSGECSNTCRKKIRILSGPRYRRWCRAIGVTYLPFERRRDRKEKREEERARGINGGGSEWSARHRRCRGDDKSGCIHVPAAVSLPLESVRGPTSTWATLTFCIASTTPFLAPLASSVDPPDMRDLTPLFSLPVDSANAGVNIDLRDARGNWMATRMDPLVSLPAGITGTERQANVPGNVPRPKCIAKKGD
ncbi:hypothetical protein KM043_006688 [Ampulex compressa]|nr:hypothetical protein KM043_006688 [Ampulex compressa]